VPPVESVPAPKPKKRAGSPRAKKAPVVEAKKAPVVEEKPAPVVEAAAAAAPAAAGAPGPEKKWYAVHALSGFEEKAKRYLQFRIQEAKAEAMFGEIIVPTETVAEVVDGKKRKSTRRSMPGYIFVEMVLTDDTWHLVRETEKITGFVGNAKQPRPMPKKEIGKVLKQMEEGVQAPKPAVTFEERMMVRITDGPFASFTGRVEEVRPEKQKLRILVTIFGRATPVELDFMQVEKI
jgi:transcriptional antiterminator NusG